MKCRRQHCGAPLSMPHLWLHRRSEGFLSEFRGHLTYFGEMPRRQAPGTLIEGILPYRGLGSGIQRALEAWSRIELKDDRDGCLFTTTVRRTAEQETAAGRVTGEVTGEVIKLL